MTGPADNLLTQLYDIKGLDSISWWPLAPGGWALVMLLVLALFVAGVYCWRRQAFKRSWKGDAWNAFDALESQLALGNVQETASALSVLLRQVAMQYFPRAECAGLQGQDWLRWLTAKDPGGFDWTNSGAFLIEAPYAPPNRNFPAGSLKNLIDAARKWLK